MYSLNLSLRNTQGLYVFTSLKLKKKKIIIRLICMKFPKKIWNLDLKGASRNLQCNLHLFLDNIEPRTENKKLKFRKNCFENVVSDWATNYLICPNMSTFVTQYFFSFLIFTNSVFSFLKLFFQSHFMNKINHFLTNLRLQ